MFSTSHLRSSTPGLSSRLSLKHMCYFSIRLPWPDSAVLCLSAHSVFPLKFPFLSPLFSLFFETNPFLSPFSLWPLLIYRSFAHAYTHTRTQTVCVLESEKVSVLFSGQLGLIFSTFCFHTLTDSPQAETERQRETHTDTPNTAFRDLVRRQARSPSAIHKQEQHSYSVGQRKTAGN